MRVFENDQGWVADCERLGSSDDRFQSLLAALLGPRIRRAVVSVGPQG